MDSNKIPADLRERRQWVLWRYDARGGKPTKVPYMPTGTMASSTDPATWSTLESVLPLADRYAGIGFVFSSDDGLCGVDLDGCRDPESGTIATWAREIIQRIGSYAEVSPSRTGVKIFCRSVNPFGTGRKIVVNAAKVCDKEPAIECYDRGRYFAVTGKRLAGLDSIIDVDLQWLKDRFAKPVVKRTSVPSTVVDRARKYLAKLPPAISGCGGHNATFRAACVLVLGFGLTQSEALMLLSEWNQACQPPWSERELVHKVESAMVQPGERNYLRDAREDQWSSIAIPDYSKSQTTEPTHTRMTTLRDSVAKVVDRLGSQTELVSTGISDLDYAIGGGMDWGEVVVLAARPSHGKSAVALQMIHEATAAGMPCLMISEEMSDIAIGKRTIQYISDLHDEQWNVRRSELEEQIQSHFSCRAECYIAESCATVKETCSQIEKHVVEHGVKIVAVDYAQLLTAAGKTRYEQVTNASIELRKITSRLGVITLMLCQLSREVEKRNPFIPHMSDLKESGQIEQDADVIAFLVWPWKVDSNEQQNKYQFFIGKNRNRPINQQCVECFFEPDRQRVRLASVARYNDVFSEFDPKRR